jgi:hypothetical protein
MAIAAHLRLVDELDLQVTKQHEQLVEWVRVDEVVWQASVEFLVTDPAALLSSVDKRAEDWVKVLKDDAHGRSSSCNAINM